MHLFIISIYALETFYIKSYNEDKYLIAKNPYECNKNPKVYNVKFGPLKEATLFTTKNTKIKDFVHIVLRNLQEIALFMNKTEKKAQFTTIKNNDEDKIKLVPFKGKKEVYLFKFKNSKCLQYNKKNGILEFAVCNNKNNLQLFEFIDGKVVTDFLDFRTVDDNKDGILGSDQIMRETNNIQAGFSQGNFNQRAIENQMIAASNLQSETARKIEAAENLCEKMTDGI